MDNYYTSVQLLQELRLKGLYARGTIRANSKHFPAHSILPKKDCTRGDYRQAVARDHSMLAASWCDDNVVNMISNADSTAITSVARCVLHTTTPICKGLIDLIKLEDDSLFLTGTPTGVGTKSWH
ncbi:Transposase [Phytophthora megakarya]|uniref:Transposase n=1 Tax=Phytophthora megakarya TaxID=4795 RepID=A0A225X405_9STRA|nr:Transposase [Phytophthora megakarya]